MPFTSPDPFAPLPVDVDIKVSSKRMTPQGEGKGFKKGQIISLPPTAISFPQLSSTLANLEREVKKRGSSGYDTLTVVGFHLTVGESVINSGKEKVGAGIVVKQRVISSGGKGGTTTKLTKWKLPGGGKVTGGVKRSIYKCNKPVDVTNATEEETKR
jgi:hypothetical protein